jgi:hypothetical protein
MPDGIQGNPVLFRKGADFQVLKGTPLSGDAKVSLCPWLTIGIEQHYLSFGQI